MYTRTNRQAKIQPTRRRPPSSFFSENSAKQLLQRINLQCDRDPCSRVNPAVNSQRVNASKLTLAIRKREGNMARR